MSTIKSDGSFLNVTSQLVAIKESSSNAAPLPGHSVLFVDSSGNLGFTNSSGNSTTVQSSTTSVLALADADTTLDAAANLTSTVLTMTPATAPRTVTITNADPGLVLHVINKDSTNHLIVDPSGVNVAASTSSGVVFENSTTAYSF